jgi:hypothetical protein
MVLPVQRELPEQPEEPVLRDLQEQLVLPEPMVPRGLPETPGVTENKVQREPRELPEVPVPPDQREQPERKELLGVPVLPGQQEPQEQVVPMARRDLQEQPVLLVPMAQQVIPEPRE